MSILVEQQDETIDTIQTSAMNVEKDTEVGWVPDWPLPRPCNVLTDLLHSLQHTDKAVSSARAARKKRWVCFIIILILLAIIAVVVAVEVLQHNKKP